MFDKEYVFKGKHAEMVKRLTAKFDEKNHQLFKYNVDVYRMAPIVGFLYGRKAEIDKSSSENTKIFSDAFTKPRETELRLVYEIVNLLSAKSEKTIDDRIDSVFRFYGMDKAKENEENFEQYVLGGIEILYEKLIEKSDDYVRNLYDFMEEFDNRYKNIMTDDIVQLTEKKK